MAESSKGRRAANTMDWRMGEPRRTEAVRPLRFHEVGEYSSMVSDHADREFILRRNAAVQESNENSTLACTLLTGAGVMHFKAPQVYDAIVPQVSRECTEPTPW